MGNFCKPDCNSVEVLKIVKAQKGCVFVCIMIQLVIAPLTFHVVAKFHLLNTVLCCAERVTNLHVEAKHKRSVNDSFSTTVTCTGR